MAQRGGDVRGESGEESGRRGGGSNLSRTNSSSSGGDGHGNCNSGGRGRGRDNRDKDRDISNSGVGDRGDHYGGQYNDNRGGGGGSRGDRDRDSKYGAGRSNNVNNNPPSRTNSGGGGGGGSNYPPPIPMDDADMREQVRQEARQRRQVAQTQPVLCGIVVSLRDNFGFLQTLSTMSADEVTNIYSTSSSAGVATQQIVGNFMEQVYFSERECYRDIAVGHEVWFTAKQTAKGMQATGLRRILQEQKCFTYYSGGAGAGTGAGVGADNDASTHIRSQNTGNASTGARRGVEIRDNDGNNIFSVIVTKGIILKDCEPQRGNIPGLIQILSCVETSSSSSSSSSSSAAAAAATCNTSKNSIDKNKGDTALEHTPLPEALLRLGVVSFTFEDISAYTRTTFQSSVTGPGGGPNSGHGQGGGLQLPLNKGDEVTFQYTYALSSTKANTGNSSFYARAVLITLSRAFKDLRAEQQLASMNAAGVRREQGIIDSFRPHDGYGFIRPVDREDLIYFREENMCYEWSEVPGATDNSVNNKEEEEEAATDQQNSGGGTTVVAAEHKKKSEEHLNRKIFDGLEVEFYVYVEKPAQGHGGSGRNPANNQPKDRAVGITTLPRGTVHFEHTIATDTSAFVIIEPRLHPREEPGILQLAKWLDYKSKDKNMVLKEIELWARCAPDGIIFRLGDEIRFDVNHFRPENLHFARNIRVIAYRSIGRHTGTVCGVQTEGGYGFIKLAASACAVDDSTSKENCFFRLSEVISSTDGTMLNSNQIRTNMRLSFDIQMEEVRSGSGSVLRSRAVRVYQIDTHVSVDDHLKLIKRNVRGKVIKDSNKRGDVPGAIELCSMNSTVIEPYSTGDVNSYSQSMGIEEMESTVDIQKIIAQDKLREALSQFNEILTTANTTANASAAIGGSTAVTIEQLSVAEVRCYYEVLTDTRIQLQNEPEWNKLHGLCCEIVTRNGANTGFSDVLHSLKVYSSSSATSFAGSGNTAYVEWLRASRAMLVDTAMAFANQYPKTYTGGVNVGIGISNGGKGLTKIRSGDARSSDVDRGERGISFFRVDIDEKMGPITRDLTVTFDLYIDMYTNSRIAKKVCLTDEEVNDYPATFDEMTSGNRTRAVSEGSASADSSDSTTNEYLDRRRLGVLDSVYSRNGKKEREGYLRALPSDEKLYWNSSTVSGTTAMVMDNNGENVPIELATEKDLTEGSLVLFSVRRRGGLRTAVNLQMFSSTNNTSSTCASGIGSGTVTLPGRALAVVVNSSMAPITSAASSTSNQQFCVLLSTNKGEPLYEKVWDIATVSRIKAKGPGRGNGGDNSKLLEYASQGGGWERKVIGDQEKGLDFWDRSKDKLGSGSGLRTDISSSADVIGVKMTTDMASISISNTTSATNSNSSPIPEDVKFFPPLQRVAVPLSLVPQYPLPIDVHNSGSSKLKPQPHSEQAISSPTFTHTCSDGTVLNMIGFEAGTLVYVDVVIDFAKSRQPVYVCNATPCSNSTHATIQTNINYTLNKGQVEGYRVHVPPMGRLLRRRGVISKPAIRPVSSTTLTGVVGAETGSNDGISISMNTPRFSSSATTIEGFEICEIRELASNVDPAKMMEQGFAAGSGFTSNSNGDNLFYCDSREIITLIGTGAGASTAVGGNGSVVVGDEVEFFGISATAADQPKGGSAGIPTSAGIYIALFAHICPRKPDKEGIVFKRTVNSDLKVASQSNAGVSFASLLSASSSATASGTGPINGWTRPQGVVMAKGPAESGSIGFTKDWRKAHLKQLSDKGTVLPWAHLLPYEI